MEMTLTVHVPRRRPLPVDVVVEWAGEHHTDELCRALADHLGESVPGLTSHGRAIEPDAPVGIPPLVHGASVVVTAAATATSGAVPGQGLLDLVVTGGPDAGRSHPLLPPGVCVGRAPAAGLALADDALSRVHAQFDVGTTGISVSDAGSTNGVLVDGSPVSRTTAVDASSTIVLGASTLSIRRVPGRGLPLEHPGDGTVLVKPSTWSAPDLGPVEVVCPTPPPERHRVRIPWIAALVPVPIGVGLAFFLGPYLLVFALMGPLVLLASALGDRWGSGRSHRSALAGHALDVEAARTRLGVALAEEGARLRQAHPDPHQVVTTAEHALPGLWAAGGGTAGGGTAGGGTVGGGERGGLLLRLGTGAVSTRVAWVDGPDRTHPEVGDAPVVVDLAEVRGLAVIGPPAVTTGHLRVLIGQLCASRAPHRLVLAVAPPDDSWSWVGLLPHTTDLPDLLTPGVPGQGATRHRVLVVPSSTDLDGATSALVTRALDAGAHVIVAATDRSHVPGGITTVVTPGAGGRHVLETPGSATCRELSLDLVGGWWAERIARALAPLRTRDGIPGGLPEAISLSQAHGVRDLSSVEVAARWRRRAGRPSTPEAVVGMTPDGPFSIDLVRDGPHVLVGGTTGSGKSEFLRTLVTSLALSCPPDELTFVLIDFKGGAAFGPCAALPHVVGLVTDLDKHLVSRALRSLGAELRRRERIFAAAGSSDLEGYHRVRAPGAESVPRLVVVIDELKALVDEVPDFVSGLVRLAALGRSLGVHLVLATQRPAGAVTAEIQANVNLRIAFRVRDRADSVDILEDPAAAGIRSSTPGRALCRGGDGSLVMFQAATVSSGAPDPPPHLTVRRPGPRPPASTTSTTSTTSNAVVGDGGVTTLAPTVAAVCAAHRALAAPQPRPPWLPPLPSRLDPPTASPFPDDDTAISADVGLLDEPDLQRVSPLVWAPADGTWLLSGRPGSGRSTALRTLVLGLAGRLPPHRLHVHLIDAVGALADLEHLPHLGTHVGPTHQRGLPGLLDHLRSDIETRRSSPPGSVAAPLVLVVIDGWEQLTETQGLLDADGVLDALYAILRDGPSVGVVGIVSGGRNLLQPRWSGIAGRTLLLGAIDPLDAALAGLRLADVPRDPPAGRAVRLVDRRECQIALSTPQHSEALIATLALSPSGHAGGPGGAWRWQELPVLARRPRDATRVSRVSRASQRADGSTAPTTLPLGVGLVSPRREVWEWDGSVVGRRLLVAGPAGSGRSNTLATIAASAVAAGIPAVVVLSADTAAGRSRFGQVPLLASGDVDTLVALRRRHPDLVVLVDDADRIGDDAPVLPVLREVIDLVDRDRGLVAVTTTPSSLASRFRGVDVDVARHRVGILLSPERPDGDLLGSRLAATPPRMPGRGVVIVRGEATELQVFLADGSG